MHRSAVVVVSVLFAVFGLACSEERAGPTVVSPAAPTPSAPPVKDAVVAIYSAFAASPTGYDRTPVLSAFYKSDNARIDADCAAGKAHPRCVGDRFACLPAGVKGKGTVKEAVVVGEMPGRSASVRVTLVFGKTEVSPMVDVTFEDGAWKVDQVRCDDAPAD
jgi:hypothetical protein